MTVEERSRIANLRLRALSGEPLSPEDEAKVALFVRLVEAEEADRLAPSDNRWERKIAAETERQERLMMLLERERAVYAQLQKIVEEIEAIDLEHRSLIGAGSV